MSLFEISSSHEEGFENRTSNKGAQFVPMGVPTVCWKDLNPKNYKDFVNEELQHCFLKNQFQSTCVYNQNGVYNKIYCTNIYEYFLFPFLSKKQLSI